MDPETAFSPLTIHPTLRKILSVFFLALCVTVGVLTYLKNFVLLDDVIPFYPRLDTILFNFKMLLQLKGGYFEFLKSWFIFLSMSGWFLFLGKTLVRRFGPKEPEAINAIQFLSLSWFLGSWVYAMVWFVLGIAGCLTKPVAMAAAFSGFVILLFQIKEEKNKISLTPFRWNLEKILILLIGIKLLLWSFLCVRPQSFDDTLSVNLALPTYYATQHRLVPNPFHVYSYFPQTAELLFTGPTLLESQGANLLIVWGTMMALMVFLYGWLSKISSKFAALAALALFVSTDIAEFLAINIKNDLQTAAFVVLHWWALFYALKSHRTSQDDHLKIWISGSGLLAGIACSFKYSAFSSVLASEIGIVLFFFLNTPGSLADKFRTIFKNQIRFNSFLFLALCPWLIRNILISGDPLYPFLASLLHIHPLEIWHKPLPIYPVEYVLRHSGWHGLLGYFGNLTRADPNGFFGHAAIWWGPSAWLCFTFLLCLTPLFVQELRWMVAISLVGWFLSLNGALISRYHVGELIFTCSCLFACSLGWFLKNQEKILRPIVFDVVGCIFIIKGLLTVERIIPLVIQTASGFHYYQIYAVHTSGSPHAMVSEINFTHYLINKYTPKEDGVLLVGHTRSNGLDRKHISGFYLDKQPILQFAEQSKDAEDLKNKLLSMGMRHVLLDHSAWKEWEEDSVKDHPHHFKVQNSDREKIRKLIEEHMVLRFKTPSEKLSWLSMATDPTQANKSEIVFDKEDFFLFTQFILNKFKQDAPNGHYDQMENTMRNIPKEEFPSSVRSNLYFYEGVVCFGRDDFKAARDCFTKSIENDPANLAAYNARHTVYIRLGQTVNAQADLLAYKKIKQANRVPSF